MKAMIVYLKISFYCVVYCSYYFAHTLLWWLKDDINVICHNRLQNVFRVFFDTSKEDFQKNKRHSFITLLRRAVDRASNAYTVVFQKVLNYTMSTKSEFLFEESNYKIENDAYIEIVNRIAFQKPTLKICYHLAKIKIIDPFLYDTMINFSVPYAKDTYVNYTQAMELSEIKLSDSLGLSPNNTKIIAILHKISSRNQERTTDSLDSYIPLYSASSKLFLNNSSEKSTDGI